MFEKISHILPYLYYRIFQFYEKHENERDAYITTWILICLIEILYVMVFFIFPMDHIFLDGGIGAGLKNAISSFTRFGVILALSPFFYLFCRLHKSRMNRYHEMMSLWKHESKTQRKVKWWILLLFYSFPILIFIPEGKILNHFFPKQTKNVVIGNIDYSKTNNIQKKPLQLEEIDDSHMWGIKKTDKEIRIIEENQ